MNDQASFPFHVSLPSPPRRRLSSPRTTFDKNRAQLAKMAGMDIAAANRHDLLELTRGAMERLARSRENREVDADDISLWLMAHGRNPSDLGPATPSVFRGKHWEFTGRWRKSERVSNHSRVNRIWRLR